MENFCQSVDIGELAKALVQAQHEMPAAKKKSVNPFFKSNYADLAEIMETVKETLGKHGLAISQLLTGEAAVTTMLIHESGQWMASTLELKPVKSDPQSMGSAITYARRYAAAAIIGLATEPDDDGNEANRPSAKGKPTPASTSQAPPTQTGDAYTEKPTVNEDELKKTTHNEIFSILKSKGIPPNTWVAENYGKGKTEKSFTVEELRAKLAELKGEEK